MSTKEPDRWRYVGPPGRIYSNVPVTPDPGDVVTWPEVPASDGAWEPTTDPANRYPDNYREEAPVDVVGELSEDDTVEIPAPSGSDS